MVDNRGRVALFAGVSMSCLVATGAWAQASQSVSPQGSGELVAMADQASPEGSAPSTGAVEEIVITANKRSENVQSVPKSVQVVSDVALQRQNVVNISDLAKLVPTIAGSGQTLAIRGVGTGASNIGSQSKVGVVLDDVPQPSRATLANNLLDIERVEVLPGPQGTLAGRNATGGLVNMVTRGPTPEWTGFASALGTSDGERQLAVFAAGPIADKIQISTSQYFRTFPGLYKNIYLNQDATESVYGTRDKIKLLPTDNLTITGTAYYQYSTRQAVTGQGGGPGGGNPIIYKTTPPANYNYIPVPSLTFAQLEPGVTPGPDNNEFASPLNGTSRDTIYGGIGKIEYNAPIGVSLTSITSYLHESNPIHSDYCGCMASVAASNVRPEWTGFVDVTNATKSFTQEFRVTSSDAGRFHYVAGLFYSYLDQTYNYNRWYQPVNWLRDFYTKSYSAYAHADYDITDKLKIQGGLRYEKDHIYYNWTFLPILAAQKITSDGIVRNFPVTNQLIVNTNSNTADFVNFDVGAQYRITSDIMVYGTFARAQQGPIYDAEDNLTAIAGPLQPLPQEKVKNYEAGIKSQLFNRRLTLNVSMFQGNYENYQVQTNIINPNPLLPPTLKVASVGKVRTRGVEVNAAARLADHLRSTLNLAYTEAKILDFPNAPCYSGATVGTASCFTVNAGTSSAFNTQGNLGGKLLANAPRWRFSYNIDYGVPFGNNGFEAFISPLVKFSSKQRTDLLGLPSSYIGNAAFIDVNVGVRSSKLTAELFVRNLTKESIETYGITANGYTPNNVIQNRVLSRDNNRYMGGRVRYTF